MLISMMRESTTGRVGVDVGIYVGRIKPFDGDAFLHSAINCNEGEDSADFRE